MTDDLDLRVKMAEVARKVLKLATFQASIPDGGHVVVVVTDASGKFVGVAGTGGETYTDAMLKCALGVMHGDEKVWIADDPEVAEVMDDEIQS